MMVMGRTKGLVTASSVRASYALHRLTWPIDEAICSHPPGQGSSCVHRSPPLESGEWKEKQEGQPLEEKEAGPSRPRGHAHTA
jgi:hypothetical protein